MRFGLIHRRLSLLFTRTNLFIVYDCYDVAGFHLIAFPYSHFEDSSGCLRGHRRIVALNTAAERDDDFGISGNEKSRLHRKYPTYGHQDQSERI